MICNIPCRIVLFVVNVASTIAGLVLLTMGALMAWGHQVLNVVMLQVLFPLISAYSRGGESKAIQDIVDRLLHTSAPVGMALFALGLLTLIISVLGFLAVCYNWKIAFHIYIGVLGFVAIVFLVGIILYYAEKTKIIDVFEKQFNQSVLDYKSMETNNMDSLIVGFVMPSLNCCGINSADDFVNMLPDDKYGDETYHNLQHPIICCKMDNYFKIMDNTCPATFDGINSNVEIPCNGLFRAKVVHFLDYGATAMIYALVILLLLAGFASLTLCVDKF